MPLLIEGTTNQTESPNQIKCWCLVRGENRSPWGKTSQNRIENQPTQSVDEEIEPGPYRRVLSSLCQACSLWYHAIHQSNPVMHQSFETPAPPAPQFGLERGIHFLCKWKWVKSSFPGIKVSGAFPRTYCSTHSTPFVKQLIIACFPSFCNWSVTKKDQNVKIPYHWQNLTCNFSLTENVGPHMHVAIQIYISFDS